MKKYLTCPIDNLPVQFLNNVSIFDSQMTCVVAGDKNG